MDNSSRIIEVDINDILPNRNQPRIILNEEDDLGLTDSVKEYGVLQPIIVRSIGDKYEIIAGERRYRASVLAGKETVPVIVRNMNDKESAEVALIENVQRKQLTPIEEALSYKNILDLGYMTQEQLAEKIGKSQPTIANKIRLLNLTDDVQEALLENEISERHARSLLKIKNKKQQTEMLHRIINERLTVRKTDEEISKLDLTIENESTDSKVKESEGETKMNNNEFINMPQFESFANATPVQPVAPAAEPQANVLGGMDVAPVADTTPAPSFNIFEGAQPAAQTNTFGLSDVTPVEQPVVPQVSITTETSDSTEGSSAPAQTIPQFDIFATTPQPEPEAPANTFIAPQPAVAPVQPVVENPIPTVEPVQPVVEAPVVAPVMETAIPTVQPVVETPVVENPIPTLEPIAEPVQPVVEAPIPTLEPIQPVVEAPQPVIEPVVETPAVAEPAPEVFATAPIQEQPTVATESIPEPIIVTDYNKQYDPVMPQMPAEPTPQVSFKEVIAAIRECANKIESYGYKIDVDEFDLTNIYQAIFKIEKM